MCEVCYKDFHEEQGSNSGCSNDKSAGEIEEMSSLFEEPDNALSMRTSVNIDSKHKAQARGQKVPRNGKSAGKNALSKLL